MVYLASNCLIDEDEKEVDISTEIKYSNNVLFKKWIRWIETNLNYSRNFNGPSPPKENPASAHTARAPAPPLPSGGGGL